MRFKKFSFFLITIVAFFLVSACSDCGMTTEEEANLDLVYYIYEEGVNKQNPDIWDGVLTDDYDRHCQAMPPGLQEFRGLDTMKVFLEDHFRAFPDWEESVDLIFAKDDKVAYITTGTGTFVERIGDFEPTGLKCEIINIIIHRFENGKVAETWISWDNVAFLTQIGVFPPSPKTY